MTNAQNEKGFISLKPENWETPFPTIGEVIRCVANVLETKGDSVSAKDFHRLAREEIFDYEKIDELWEEAFNIPKELKLEETQKTLDELKTHLLKEYIGLSQEMISCEYQRSDVLKYFQLRIAHVLTVSLKRILGKEKELFAKFIFEPNPLTVAFEWKYLVEWETFRKNENNDNIKENLYRWNETPRRKQRGIVSGITLFFSPQAAGNLPLEIKKDEQQIPSMIDLFEEITLCSH